MVKQPLEPAIFDGCPIGECPASRRRYRGENGKQVLFACGYLIARVPCRHPAHRDEWRAAVWRALTFTGALRALGIAPKGK